MMRGYLIWRILAAICMAMILIGGIDQTTKNALKVKHILRKIKMHQTQPDKKVNSEKVTEAELNAYISYRLAQEKNTPIHNLKVNLLDSNQVHGTIQLDGKALNLNLLFGETLLFNFKGIVHSQKGAARIDLKSLKLNGQPVTPQMLDLIIRTVAQINGTEARGLGDWYDLPKGIKYIMVYQDMVILYY